MKINEQSIRKACNDLADILVAKNRDYGNSVEEQFKEYGITSGLIRLDDKMRRLKNLKYQPSMNVKEPLKDTATDLSGYAVLLSILLSSEDTIEMINVPVETAHVDGWKTYKPGDTIITKRTVTPIGQFCDMNFQPIPPYFDPDDQ